MRRAGLFSLFVGSLGHPNLRMDPTMSLREHERRQRQRRQSRARPSDDLPPLPDDDEVLTFLDWCRLNTIGARTGRKIRASGKGPTFTQLSDRRIGVTKRNNRIWQAQRAR
jgi:hypothetical protein